MRLWERLKKKGTYISILIIVLGNLLLLSTVENLIVKYIQLTGPLWLLEFISMFLITFVLFLTTVEVFEI
jgi:hypothetical protein